MARRGKVIRFPKTPTEPEGREAEGRGERWADNRGFVEIRRCRDQSEALVIKGLFDSEEIPCLLRSRLAHSVHPFSVGAQGEVVILVPQADAARARRLLARAAPGPSFP
jgi:hypothetical protein